MATIPFAGRLEAIGFSSSQASALRVRALRQAGVRVHDFGSKLDTPAHIKAAAQRYLESPAASLYADPHGLPELRQAIARKMARDGRVPPDPGAEVTVTPGGKMAILATLLALVGPGDEVLMEDPGWLGFEPMVRLSGATPTPLPLREEDEFRFRLGDLRAAITPRTRVLILCNPHNPTGRILARADLEAIAQVAIERNLVVIMDEAYDQFLFDGLVHVGMADLAGMRERTVTVNTASKIYNMFGWRVGWVVAPAAITDKIRLVCVHSFTCVTSFAQAGAAAALEGETAQGTLTGPELARQYQDQRDALVAGLRAIPGVTCTLPRGAYFAFPNFSRFGLSSQELSDRFIAHARVAGLPGSVFGAQGEGYIRFVFNAPAAEIAEGVEVLRQYCSTLR